MSGAVAAIDLGATSGRVVIGRVGPGRLELDVVARFPNGPVDTGGGLHWDARALFSHSVTGLAEAYRREPEIASIGVDSWAVDYGLLRDGELVDEPYHYRDPRTARGVEATDLIVGRAELHRQNGLQFLPFNTVYQLVADRLDGRLGMADRALLIPDLIDFWLSGSQSCERTNASTTGLVDIVTGEWNGRLLQQLGITSSLLPPLVDPGTMVGLTRPEITAQLGAPRPVPIVAVGSHDTASAVVAVPMDASTAAYISCGTWGLVGVELEAPVLTPAGRHANFTNELGVDGRVRFLRNVMGLWMLSECERAWAAEGSPVELPALLGEAAGINGEVAVIDVDDPRFVAPGDMPTRIAAYCVERDLPVPTGRAELTRSIVESLAQGFAAAVEDAAALSGHTVTAVHIVGGGALNTLLCQLTADRTGREVFAGPVEATALGNVLVQARAAGFVRGELETLRALVTSTHRVERYAPRPRR